MANREPQNQYAATMANDLAAELVQIVITFYRGHRGVFNSTQITNITAEITNILNGTHKV